MDTLERRFGPRLAQGLRHDIWDLPREGQVLVQRREEGLCPREDFLISCHCYELWKRAGLPVRYIAQREDLQALTFVGHNVEMIRPPAKVIRASRSKIYFGFDSQDHELSDEMMGAIHRLAIWAFSVLETTFAHQGLILYGMPLEFGVTTETGELQLATSVDAWDLSFIGMPLPPDELAEVIADFDAVQIGGE